MITSGTRKSSYTKLAESLFGRRAGRTDLTSAPKSDTTRTREQEELAALVPLLRWTHWLDESLRIPGTGIRLGWDSIIGLVPGIGDAATAAMSLYIVWSARKLNVSRWTQFRMLTNVLLDTIIGSVPLVGDFADVAFKANRKNLQLIRNDVARRHNRPDIAKRG